MCHNDDPTSSAGDSLTVASIQDLYKSLDLPRTHMCIEALEIAHKELERPIFNHSLRVFLYADWFTKRDKITAQTDQREILFVACLLHDIGTSDSCNGPRRFEVEGADRAAALLRNYDAAGTDVYQTWLAIALHTSSGIAEHAGRIPLLVRTAVLLDFVEDQRLRLHASHFQHSIELLLPRFQVERVLANAVVRQALEQPGKAPTSSWPGRLVEAHLKDPDWDRNNPAF